MIGIPHRTTLFCDFDGPIVDVSERYYETYCMSLKHMAQRALASASTYSYTVLSKEQFWYLKQERVPDFEIALRSNIPDHQVESFLDTVRSLVNQPFLLHRDCLQPGIRWALELMHSQGIRLVLVTLRCQRQVEELLRAYQLDHLFRAVWGTKEDEAAYINSAASKTTLLKAAWVQSCERYGVPQRAWMVGDTEADILAGQATGISTVALTCGIRSRSYLMQYKPNHICADLVSVTHSLVSGPYAASL